MQNKKKIKVCNISMHYLPINGGQEVYIDNLNKILKNNNFLVSVLQRRFNTNQN